MVIIAALIWGFVLLLVFFGFVWMFTQWWFWVGLAGCMIYFHLIHQPLRKRRARYWAAVQAQQAEEQRIRSAQRMADYEAHQARLAQAEAEREESRRIAHTLEVTPTPRLFKNL
jgi:hypothetical protein